MLSQRLSVQFSVFKVQKIEVAAGVTLKLRSSVVIGNFGRLAWRNLHRKDFNAILDLFKEKYRFSLVSLYCYIEASLGNSPHQKSQRLGTLGLLFLSGLLRVLMCDLLFCSVLFWYFRYYHFSILLSIYFMHIYVEYMFWLEFFIFPCII